MKSAKFIGGYTGGPRYSRGFRSKNVPRIPKPRILSLKMTQKQWFRSCFLLLAMKTSKQGHKFCEKYYMFYEKCEKIYVSVKWINEFLN